MAINVQKSKNKNEKSNFPVLKDRKTVTSNNSKLAFTQKILINLIFILYRLFLFKRVLLKINEKEMRYISII